jgi:DNA-binding transcriptional LysR family regulator
MHLVDAHHRGQKLVTAYFGLVASPGYLAARGVPATLESLREHDCLPQSRRTGPVHWSLQGPEGVKDIQVSSRFRANTARGVLRAAVAGLGIALLPYPIINSEIEAGRLVRVLPQFRRAGADLYAVCVSRRQIPRVVSTFIEFVSDKLRIAMANMAPPSRSRVDRRIVAQHTSIQRREGL